MFNLRLHNYALAEASKLLISRFMFYILQYIPRMIRKLRISCISTLYFFSFIDYLTFETWHLDIAILAFP